MQLLEDALAVVKANYSPKHYLSNFTIEELMFPLPLEMIKRNMSYSSSKAASKFCNVGNWCSFHGHQ